MQNPALMATKTSICIFYLTLAKNQRIFRITTVATLLVVNVAGIALTFLNVFQCRPVGAAFLDPPPESATCIDIVTLYLSSAPVNIITDLALLFLPMPILTGMRLPRNEKLILIITFSFGAFVAVVDVVRIAYLESAALAKLKSTTGEGSINEYGDYSWVASLSFMWSAVEVHVGMICACVPGIKPLVAKVFPAFLGRIKAAGQLQGNPFAGPGDAQWANIKPKSQRASTLPPRSPGPASAPISPVTPAMQPRPKAEDSDSQEPEPKDDQEMGMMDFLTTPDTTAATLKLNHATTSPAALTLSPTHATWGDTQSRPRTPSLTIFDFVNMKNPKSMVKLTNKESIFPNSLVTILFFLWGFAYGLLSVLNEQFQVVTHISSSQAVGLHAAYYGAYLIAPLTFAGYVFRKAGFKASFMCGLCIYGVGTLVFWPSAVLASFPAFLISNFFIGLGVATLETAGNPFISLCGPPEYAETRLNISQGVQAIGTVVAPILAKKVLFKNVNDAPSLVDVQWTYLGIALFDVILALIFFYLPIPEASDEELETQALKRDAIHRRKVLGLPVIYTTLIIGVFSQFCYVGGQESIATYCQEYITLVRPNSTLSPFDYQSLGHTVFAVGRFLTAFMGVWLKPRHILGLLYAGVIITSALAMSTNGYTGVAMIVLIFLFESGIFSLIFAISLRGLGAKTKWGAIALAAGTSGGAVIPGIESPVRDGRGVKYSYAVIVAAFAFGAVMPLYLEAVPAARKQVDPVCLDGAKRRSTILQRANGGGDDEKRSKKRRASEVLKSAFSIRKTTHPNERGKEKEESSMTTDATPVVDRGEDDGPDFEHVEAFAGRSQRST